MMDDGRMTKDEVSIYRNSEIFVVPGHQFLKELLSHWVYSKGRKDHEGVGGECRIDNTN